jgi:hypothetical protein
MPVFAQLASEMLGALKGTAGVRVDVQYFPSQGKEAPTAASIRKATGCRNVRAGYEKGVVAEACTSYPDSIEDAHGVALYAYLKGVGAIAVFPGNPDSELSRDPVYSWRDKTKGAEAVRKRVDRTLAKKNWEKATEMFFTSIGLS